MCAIIIIRMTLIADYPSPRSVIRISVKGDQIDREGWSVYLKYTPGCCDLEIMAFIKGDTKE